MGWMVETKRSEWARPEVIVLARTRPEEAVLSVCKGDSLNLPMGKQQDLRCYRGNPSNMCSIISTS
jgi:hypothetical protein